MNSESFSAKGSRTPTITMENSSGSKIGIIVLYKEFKSQKRTILVQSSKSPPKNQTTWQVLDIGEIITTQTFHFIIYVLITEKLAKNPREVGGEIKVRLLNSVPKNIRNPSQSTVEVFRRKLNYWFNSVPELTPSK